MSLLRTVAIVLAAGKSERMGTNKLLLEVAGRTVLDRILDVLESSRISQIFVVLGHNPEALRPLVESHCLKVVINPDYESGMTSSFKAGLRLVSSDAAFLVLGDQIGLEADLLDQMIEMMASDADALIVSPKYKGQRGHPVLFRRKLFREILNLGEKEILRDLVNKNEAGHRDVEGSFWCTLDMDNPEEYEKVKKIFESGVGVSTQ